MSPTTICGTLSHKVMICAKHNDQSVIPIGQCAIFPNNSHTIEGWLELNGQALSKKDYSELYSVIGDRYSAEDGSCPADCFNIPQLGETPRMLRATPLIAMPLIDEVPLHWL